MNLLNLRKFTTAKAKVFNNEANFNPNCCSPLIKIRKQLGIFKINLKGSKINGFWSQLFRINFQFATSFFKGSPVYKGRELNWKIQVDLTPF